MSRGLHGRGAHPGREGARWSALAVVLPFLLGMLLPHPIGAALRQGSLLAASELIVSHPLVRIIEDLATHPRPSPAHPHCRVIEAPACFSFPSGHAAASAAVAASYGATFPALAPPLALVALAIGASRIRLGVHYPGDVLAWQVIAMLTALTLATAG